jgi:hypothetical protein
MVAAAAVALHVTLGAGARLHRHALTTIGLGFLLFLGGLEVRFDLGALAGSSSMVPLFLAALLAVRGVPALVYRSTRARRWWPACSGRPRCRSWWRRRRSGVSSGSSAPARPPR